MKGVITIEDIMQKILAENQAAKQIIKRAAIVAVIIGGLLTLINQTAVIFGDADPQYTRMVLAFLTPFLVVGSSQFFGIRAASEALSQNTGNQHGFVQTLFSHGIPVRSVVMGLIAGGATAIIATTTNMAARQNINQLHLDLVLPAVVLPIIFGAFAQVLAFRRTIRQSGRLS